ncbi:MAG: hypothetical protein HPY71_01715 [Firmicutes bacterium]|nr:hypothetical protein [Bacillota bacterium]
MPDAMTELAVELQRMARQASSQAIAGLASELGTITAKGVKLDRYKHEFTDPLVLEPVIDLDIELTLKVPKHDETGQIVLPAIPTQAHSPTVAGTYTVTYKFDDWIYNAEEKPEKLIKITKARIKHKPEYKPGDRVICALVNGGRDVVIISRVVPYA